MSAPGRKRANGPTRAPLPMRAPTMWQLAMMWAPSSTTTPGPKNTLGSIDHVAADRRVEAEPHRLRRHQRGALLHGPAPGARLEHGLGRGQLLARVDAQRLLGRAGDRPASPARRRRRARPRRSGSIRSWRCALPMRPSSPARSGTRNAIAPALHRPMRRSASRCIACPRGSPATRPSGVDDQAAVAVGIRRPRSPARRCGRRPQRLDQPAQRRRLDQRRIGEQHDHVAACGAPARAARPARHRPVPACVACSNTSMPGAAFAASARTASMPGATTRAMLGRPGRARDGEHVRQHRAAGDGVQHLGHRRAHAHALAGGENDDQQRVLGHAQDGRRGVAATHMGSGGCLATCVPVILGLSFWAVARRDCRSARTNRPG